MTPRDASIALSFGGLGLFMLGRVVGSIVMQHVGSERVLRLCAIGTFATTFAVVLNLGVLSMAALVLVYVFESIMFPTIFALSLRGLGPLTKRASSLLMMTPVGGAVGLCSWVGGRCVHHVGGFHRAVGGFCQCGRLCLCTQQANVLKTASPLPCRRGK